MRSVPLSALALVLILSGCAGATSSFAPSGGGSAPPFQGTPEVLSVLPPDGTYRLLGVVTVQGVGITDDEDMMSVLRREAASNGADAVVPQGAIRERRTGDGGTERILAGFAIRRR